MASIF
jgi:dolichyl-phosphate-mannose--protein O-mannosyl transferase